MSKPAMICKLVKAGQTAKRLVGYVAGKSIGLRADLGFGMMRLRRTMLPWAARVLRAHRDSCPRASEVRHVIFSVPKNTPRRAAFAALHAVFTDWRNMYAPGLPWVAAIQKHNGIYHLHAAVANVNSSGRPLKIRPHQVVAMADMRFTQHAVSAKGTGKKGLALYTKARGKLVVEDLAELLAAPGGGIRADVWKQLTDMGLLSDLRERKDGSVVSFCYQDRRMRFATLEGFAARLPVADSSSGGASTGAPVAAKKPAEPLPGSIAAKLAAAGFSNKDLASLRSNLRSVRVLPHKAENQKNKNKQPNRPRK